MHTLKVYDKKNPERLLGTLKTERFFGSSLQVAIIKRLDSRGIRPPRYSNDIATFDAEWRTLEDEQSWTQRTLKQERVLETDAPLDDLLSLDRFTVHGEEHLVDHRRYY